MQTVSARQQPVGDHVAPDCVRVVQVLRPMRKQGPSDPLPPQMLPNGCVMFCPSFSLMLSA